MIRIEPANITVRSCNSHDDFKLCLDLQRRVWGYAEEDVVPTSIFVVAQHSGGHAYIAFDGEKAVGFALAFSADRGGERYWHSHMVGILPEYQNHGVGRMLKLHQRDEAIKAGIRTIEWTFDPLELRNAYFNIGRLGAISRHYIPDCYGPSSSPVHGSLPTDRLLAVWHVAGRPQLVSTEQIEVPVSSRIREFKDSGDPCAFEIQTALRNRLTELFSDGYAVVGFRRDLEQGVYILERYEDRTG